MINKERFNIRNLSFFLFRNEDDSDDEDDDEDGEDGVDNELLDSDEDELDDEGQVYLESLQVSSHFLLLVQASLLMEDRNDINFLILILVIFFTYKINHMNIGYIFFVILSVPSFRPIFFLSYIRGYI